jgi:hypothetical protein
MAKNSRLQYHFGDFLKFNVIFCLVLSGYAWNGIGLAWDDAWLETLLTPMIAAFVVALSMMRPKHWASPRCVLCDRPYLPFPRVHASGTCPACRIERLPRPDRRTLERRGLILIALLVTTLAAALIWPFSDLVMRRVGGRNVIMLPMITITLAMLLFAAFVGHATAWGFGAKAPIALLQKAMEVATLRFEVLTGQPLPAPRALDVFVFAKRDAFEHFLKRAVLCSGTDHDGMFIPWSTRTIACTLDLPPSRLAPPDRMLRTVFAYDALASAKHAPVPGWLQIGIAQVVSGDNSELDRLDRHMLAALARERSLSAPILFEPTPRFLAAAQRNLEAHGDFVRYVQFVLQSWSVVEFLVGVRSPAGHKQRFRAFLWELDRASHAEAVFERYFGFGFETLLAGWRNWVLARGTGSHGPTPRRALDLLRERVLPIVRDSSMPVETRVRAIREMGKAGFLLGANELVALLELDDGALRPEAVWALESISGKALGENLEDWERWWEGVASDETELIANE